MVATLLSSPGADTGIDVLHFQEVENRLEIVDRHFDFRFLRNRKPTLENDARRQSVNNAMTSRAKYNGIDI